MVCTVDGNGWDDDFDVLPDITADESGPGWGDDPGERDGDQRLRDERPPHWDGRGH